MTKTRILNQVAPATDRIENIFATPEELLMFVFGANWQDGHVTGTFLKSTTPLLTCRHVSRPVSPCAVDLREMRS